MELLFTFSLVGQKRNKTPSHDCLPCADFSRKHTQCYLHYIKQLAKTYSVLLNLNTNEPFCGLPPSALLMRRVTVVSQNTTYFLS